MKLQGKIVNWNDKKGFGFVEPYGGGERAFVHMSAFKARSRRPVNGESIVYELERDKHNRYQAVKVAFPRGSKSVNSKYKHNPKRGGAFTTVSFCIVLAGSIYMGLLPLYVAVLYLVMSFLSFMAYAIDKSAAQKDRWRTKESTLQMLSLLYGWPGAYLAQKMLSHKSRKTSFKRVYWVTVILNLMSLAWLYTENGMHFLDEFISPLLNSLSLI